MRLKHVALSRKIYGGDMIEIKVNGEQEYKIEPDKKNPNNGVLNGSDYEVDAQEIESGYLHVLHENKSYRVDVVEYSQEKAIIKVNGRTYELEMKDEMDLLLEKMGMAKGAGVGIQELKAPMPGMVLDVMVKPGDELAKDVPMLVLEAMKMENVLKSPADGLVVQSVYAEKGTAVEKNEILIVFE